MSTGIRRVTREELYALVWAKPMIRIAEEFGVSTTTLAQICARLDVPCPPRGHWIKKEFGKKLVSFELPPRTDDVPESAEIVAAAPRPAALQEAARSAAEATERVADVTVPDSMRNLHPRVMAWLAEHSEAQRRRREEARQHGRDSWYARVPVADLTERDQYRFRVTSAIFTALEKAGGGIEASPINGRVTFLIDGHRVDCSIAEKLVRSSRPRDEAHDWTAYPHWHSFGLTSSGFLRVTITHYSAGRQWIETDRKSMSDMLPGIVGGIMACGPILEQKQRERDEWHRQYREAEAIREAAERRRQVDQERWNTFRAFAANWKRQRKLLAFIADVEARAASEATEAIDGQTIPEWIAWARQHADALDPLKDGVVGMFEAVAKAAKR